MTGHPAKMFVDKESAFNGRDWEKEEKHWRAICTDHSNLVKFKPHDPHYRIVLDILKSLNSVNTESVILSRLKSGAM